MSKKIFRSMVFFSVMILVSVLLRAELPVKEGYIEFAGGRTWYKIVGDGPGIPIITVHGGPAASHFYLEPLEAMAVERPVIFYDQRGCGNSDPLDTSFWTIEFFAEELNQLIKQLGLRKFHLFGQSWGSMVATDFILNNNPEGLISLIYSGPCLDARRWVADQRYWLTQMPEDLQQIIYDTEKSGNFSSTDYQDAMTEYYNKHLCRRVPWPEALVKTFEFMNPYIYEFMWGPSEFTCSGTLQDYDRTAYLHLINVPTLFTCGEYDEARPETVKYYKRLISHSEIEVFKNCSHETFLEQPKLYNKVLSKFLKKVEKKYRR